MRLINKKRRNFEVTSVDELVRQIKILGRRIHRAAPVWSPRARKQLRQAIALLQRVCSGPEDTPHLETARSGFLPVDERQTTHTAILPVVQADGISSPRTVTRGHIQPEEEELAA